MPQIVTDRLILRRYRAGEHHLMHRVLADPRVTFWREQPMQDAETRAVFDRQAALPDGLGWWAVFLNDAVERDGTPAFIGHVILQPLAVVDEIEIGWHFVPEYWRRGFATEAARAMLQHGFATLGLERIAAVVLPDNARSLGVVHRLGLEDRGTAIHAGRVHRYFVIERDEAGAGMNPVDAAGE